MTMVIRAARASDLAAVVDVGHRTWPATYGPIAGDDYVAMGLAKWWTEDATMSAIRAGRVTVAELDGEVVGMASVGPHDHQLALWKLYVLPQHQGAGAGSLLLESVLAAAAAAEHTQICLSFMVGNTSAEGFYRSKGFVETGRESGGAGIPESVWMQLTLPGPRDADDPPAG
jgi:ribosomal protein S18 acetylase RimI-like enzyme